MISLKSSQNKGKYVHFDVQNKGNTQNMTHREILLEMYEKLWNADKDKFTWNAILKDTLEKLGATSKK